MNSMSIRTEPWQAAEVAGPKRAMIINSVAIHIYRPQIFTTLVRHSKNPVLIVGSLAPQISFSNGDLVDYAIQIAESVGMPIVSSPSALKIFLNRDFKRIFAMSVMDITNRLIDASWTGLEGKGQHDLAIFMGFKYNICWLILSSLKHFSQNLKTVSLEMHYHPHALWSFPNMSKLEWEKNLDAIIRGLREGK